MSPAPVTSSRDPSMSPVSRSTRSGSVVSTRTCVPSGIRPTQATSWSSPSTSSAAASPASSADGSSVTTTSQVCRTCSPSRNRATPARSRSAPNRSSRQEPSSAAATSASRSRNAASAVTDARTCSSGDRASHRSQIGLSSSAPGAGVPCRPASSTSVKMSAPDPRWESTWAIDQEWYDGRSTSSPAAPRQLLPAGRATAAVRRAPGRPRDSATPGSGAGRRARWAGVSCDGPDVAHDPRPVTVARNAPCLRHRNPAGAPAVPGVSRR